MHSLLLKSLNFVWVLLQDIVFCKLHGKAIYLRVYKIFLFINTHIAYISFHHEYCMIIASWSTRKTQ